MIELECKFIRAQIGLYLNKSSCEKKAFFIVQFSVFAVKPKNNTVLKKYSFVIYLN